MLRRGRFGDVVARQLDLFEQDAASLVREAKDTDDAWTRAAKDEAEELYGDYQLVVDELAERLLDVRESYAATLDEATSHEYRRAFDRAARRRFKRYAGLLAE